MLTTLPRSARRASSRDNARANPVPARAPSHGQVGMLVHFPHRMAVAKPGATSGQCRVNAKRKAREEFWTEERRTVLIRVSAEVEPYFRQHLHTLGDRARIDGRTPDRYGGFWLDLAVHIPGAPAEAVTAIPTYRSVWRGDHYEPEFDYVDWMDADGQRIEAN